MVFQCHTWGVYKDFDQDPEPSVKLYMGILLPTTPRKTICLYPTSCFFISAPLVGWFSWVNLGRGRGRGAQEPFLSPEVCFLKLFFNSVGLCKEAWKVATPFKAVETRPSFGESLFFHIFPKSVVYFWILHDKFFSISSLEVVDAEGCNSKRFKALGTQDIPKAPRLQRNDLLRRLPSRKNAMRSITLEFETFAGFVILVT